MTLALHSPSSFSASRSFDPSASRESESRSSSSETEILIIDDHPAIQEALSAALGDAEGMRVAGAFGTIDEVWTFLEEQVPDVCIVDLSLGEGEGLALIEKIRAERSETQVLVYSMHDENLYAGEALRAGAMGYVPKSAPTDAVIDAIHRLEQGEVYLSRETTSQILGTVIRDRRYGANPVEQLTDRELTVFRMIGEGKSVREIADQLDLSRKTVETYRRRAKEKLGYETVDELLRFAVQWRAREGDRD